MPALGCKTEIGARPAPTDAPELRSGYHHEERRRSQAVHDPNQRAGLRSRPPSLHLARISQHHLSHGPRGAGETGSGAARNRRAAGPLRGDEHAGHHRLRLLCRMWPGRRGPPRRGEGRVHHRHVSRQPAGDRRRPRTQRLSEEARLGEAVRRFRHARRHAGLRRVERGACHHGLQAQALRPGKSPAGNLRSDLHAEDPAELRQAPAHLRTGARADH